MMNSIISNAIVVAVSDNDGFEVEYCSPSMTNKLMEKLFEVCMAELTSIPFVFQVNGLGRI